MPATVTVPGQLTVTATGAQASGEDERLRRPHARLGRAAHPVLVPDHGAEARAGESAPADAGHTQGNDRGRAGASDALPLPDRRRRQLPRPGARLPRPRARRRGERRRRRARRATSIRTSRSTAPRTALPAYTALPLDFNPYRTSYGFRRRVAAVLLPADGHLRRRLRQHERGRQAVHVPLLGERRDAAEAQGALDSRVDRGRGDRRRLRDRSQARSSRRSTGSASPLASAPARSASLPPRGATASCSPSPTTRRRRTRRTSRRSFRTRRRFAPARVRVSLVAVRARVVRREVREVPLRPTAGTRRDRARARPRGGAASSGGASVAAAPRAGRGAATPPPRAARRPLRAGRGRSRSLPDRIDGPSARIGRREVLRHRPRSSGPDRRRLWRLIEADDHGASPDRRRAPVARRARLSDVPRQRHGQRLRGDARRSDAEGRQDGGAKDGHGFGGRTRTRDVRCDDACHARAARGACVLAFGEGRLTSARGEGARRRHALICCASTQSPVTV